MRSFILFKFTFWALLLLSYTAQAQWYQHSFKVMGTMSHVELWLDDSEDGNAQATIDKANQLIAKVEQEMFRIDQQMSPYIKQSELSKVNRDAGIKAVEISSELFELLGIAHDISTLSQGAFDVTYASVGYQYNYREQKRPDQQAITSALPSIDYASVQLSPLTNTVRFSSDKVKIDLGGIAKGYAVKRCLAILKSAGVEHALVSAGGDTGLLGDRYGRPWLVAIKHPRADNKNAAVIPLSNEAISTSGDYERFFVEEGVRYHHIINPKTGDSARKVVSVSIIGDDPTYVDALSTTVFVKGLKEGMALINSLNNFEAIIIDNNQRLHFSNGLQQ